MSQLFKYESHEVRTLTENSETWFSAQDVCRCLGLTWQGHSLDAIPDEWKKLVRYANFSRSMRFIREPAVYKLAFRSNKPEADAFTNWVASEVLPAIRRTGTFAAKPKRKALPSAPLPRPARPQSDGLPPEALAAMTGSQRAKRFRRLMEEVRGLAQKVGSTMDMVRFTTHPGARYVRLAPELDARYNALDQMHKIAVAGLYQAEHMLYCLYFLGEGVEFK